MSRKAASFSANDPVEPRFRIEAICDTRSSMSVRISSQVCLFLTTSILKTRIANISA